MKTSALFARWLAERLDAADLVHAHMFGAWWAAALGAPRDVPVVASEHNALTWPLGDYAWCTVDTSARVDRFFVHGPDPHAFVRDIGVDPTKVLPGRSAIAGATVHVVLWVRILRRLPPAAQR